MPLTLVFGESGVNSTQSRANVTIMLPFDADPVIAEARELSRELRIARIAATTAKSGTEAQHLADIEGLSAKLDILLTDPAHKVILDHALDERARTLRLAIAAWREQNRSRRMLREADEIVAGAATTGRALTTSERARRDSLRAAAAANDVPTVARHKMLEPRGSWEQEITSISRRDGVLTALGALRLREARAQLREGLLLTDQMRAIITEALPAMLRGEPILFVGETGGAKTALAEYLTKAEAGLTPEFVSGYGDITGAQLIGSHALRAEYGATVSTFVPGPLLRAMTEGRPVILDEINAMPAEFLKRLNRILQLRPGDVMGVQEDGGREVRVAPGFAILATANEQTPHRYRGLDRLSAELVNRFGANGFRVHYPDNGRRYDEIPTENALLAAAAVVDTRGELPPDFSAEELMRVSKAAFISQQVFAGSHGEGFTDYISTERDIDGRPGLDEAVLAPRTLVAIVQKVAESAGAVTLDRALTRFVESIMHREDRRVLALICEGQGFRLGS